MNNPVENNSPQTLLFIAYCIKMWCKLEIVPRSTRHSAIGCLNNDTVHSPPHQAKFDRFPSTARFAEYFKSRKVCSCQADFLNARFSENINNSYHLKQKKASPHMRVYAFTCSIKYTVCFALWLFQQPKMAHAFVLSIKFPYKQIYLYFISIQKYKSQIILQSLYTLHHSTHVGCYACISAKKNPLQHPYLSL